MRGTGSTGSRYLPGSENRKKSQKNHRSVARLGFPILDVPDPAELKMATLEPDMAILIFASLQDTDYLPAKGGARHSQAIISPMIA
jgi:hypothetical protein